MKEVTAQSKTQLANKGVRKYSQATHNNSGRPVLIRDKQFNGEGKPKTDRERRGKFHVWGYSRSGGKDGPPIQTTIAIVELEDGRITTKRPDDITFLDVENE